MKKPHTIVIGSRIDAKIAKQLQEICEQECDTQARIFRKLLTEWVKSQTNKKRK